MNERSAHYQALFTSAIDGIILINNRGIIQEINPAALVLFQYNEDELLGKNISVLMPSPDKENHDKYIENYNRTHKPKIIGQGRNVEGLKKDGTIFPFRLAVTEVKDQKEQLFAGVIHDLTKEMEAQKQLFDHTQKLEETVKERTLELENSQRLYLEMAKNFPNGTVSVLDKSLNIIFTEGKEWKVRQLDPSKISNNSFCDVLKIDDLNLQHELLKTFDGENISLSYTNNRNYYELVSTPIKGLNGEIDEILVVEINNTKQKEAELEITNALNKEKTLHVMKSRFVSMASHEFRTPLSTILSSAILLGKYKSYEPEKTDKHLQRIRSNVQNLNQILEDFLSIDRINEGKLQAKKQRFDLCKLISPLCEELDSSLKPGQKIKVHCPKKSLEVNLDKQLLRNIILNVLSNAIKYSEKNIDFIVEENKVLKIKIIDRGIGIPEREQDQLFQRFFRAENVINIQGTGLGLHIVKRYLDLLNGKIKIKSSLGVGTTVTLTFKNY